MAQLPNVGNAVLDDAKITEYLVHVIPHLHHRDTDYTEKEEEVVEKPMFTFPARVPIF